MLKTYFKLMGFASPLSRYVIPYFFCAVLYAIFNTFNYAMITPILKALFLDADYAFVATYDMPELAFDSSIFNSLINYGYTLAFGDDYTVQKMLILLASITVLMSLLSNTFRYLCAITVESMRARTVERIRNEMYDHVMDMNAGFFSEQRKGDIIAKITNDVTAVQFCITNTLQVLFREPFLVIGYLSAMIVMSWQLSIFSMLFLPLVAVIIGNVVKRLRKPATKSMELNSEMVSVLDESLAGIKVIKSYTATDYIKDKYHDINGNAARVTLDMAKRQQMASPMSEIMGVTAVGIIIVFGGALVSTGELEAATFLAFIAIFSQITRPVRTFIEQFANINIGVAAGDRIFALINEKNEMEDKPTSIEMPTFHDEIEFRNVTFSYDGKRDVLKNISFKVRKGETVALVGPSGGGKSTIGELIPRFYDPTSGEVLVDGVSLKDLKQESVRKQMGSVAQDTILFNDTILSNLAFGRQGATREEVIAAAEIANAHKFVEETEHGYDTNIGDRGMKLSGGQRQRLSIARAVLKNPDILILDEATSALDTESEKLVQEALTKLLVGRTSIVIAHRLSTIHNADRIIVIDKGEIVESGTHSELIALDGMYSKLVDMQSFD